MLLASKDAFNINSVVEELKLQYTDQQILKARHVSIFENFPHIYWTVININQILDIIQFEFLHSIMVIFCIDIIARLPWFALDSICYQQKLWTNRYIGLLMGYGGGEAQKSQNYRGGYKVEVEWCYFVDHW